MIAVTVLQFSKDKIQKITELFQHCIKINF